MEFVFLTAQKVMNFQKLTQNGTGNRWLNFADDLGHYLDPGIIYDINLETFLCMLIINEIF